MMMKKTRWISMFLALMLAVAAVGPALAAKVEKADKAATQTEETVQASTKKTKTAKANASASVKISPKKRERAVGKTAKFAIKASGLKGTVTYQWQYSADNGDSWKNCTDSGAKTANLAVTVTVASYGYLYRCVVTDKNSTYTTSNTVYIEPTNSGDFTFADDGNGGWNIGSYDGDSTAVTVPAGHKGRKVTAIAAGAFQYSGIKSVVIPTSIRTIGARAFQNCWLLTTVTMSNRVTSLGSAAFKNCTSLKVMLIGN